MRAKRIAIVASLLLSLGASGWLGSEILFDGASSDTVYASGPQPRPVNPASLSGRDAETSNQVETRSGSITHYFVWAGALLAFTVLCVSLVLFRSEVRSEKAAGRARRQRLEYYRDLRRYKEQMQGPPHDNT